MTSENTYKVIELVGTSPEGVTKAIENAISRASQTLQGLDGLKLRRFEVTSKMARWAGIRSNSGLASES